MNTSVAFFRARRDLFTSLPALVGYWVLLTAVALAPYLFFGKIIAPGADAINYFYPAYYWFSEALKSGQSFLWNPSIFSGFPMYISQVGGFFEPLNLILFSTLPFLFAYHLRLAFDYVLVMLFSYLAARTWGISKLAAFFVGPMYLLSLHWWYLSTIHFSNSLFVLPFLFWVYMRARDADTLRQRLLRTLLGGFGLGWAFLGGYAQFIVYSLTLLGIFAVADFVWVLEREKRTVRNALGLVLVLGGIAGVGVLVGLPQILPSLAYTPISVRGGGLSYNLTQFKVLEWQELVFLIFPDYLRFPFINGGKKALYIGPLFLMFAMTAILHVRRDRRVQVFLGLSALAFLLAIPGSYFYFFLHKLPVFELFRFPSRWLFNGIWALCVLGAFGFDILRNEIQSKAVQGLAIAAGVCAAALTLFVGLCTFAGEWFWGPVKTLGFWIFSTLLLSPSTFSKDPSHYQAALGRGVDAWRDLASLDNAYFAIPFLLLVAATCVFVMRARGKLSRVQFSVVSACILICTFLGIFIARWPDTVSGSIITDAESGVLSVIPREELDQYRVHHFHPGYRYQPRDTSLIWSTEDTNVAVVLAHALAVPNTNQFTGIRLTDGYEPFVSRDLLQVSATLLASTYTSQDILTGVTMEERVQIFLSHLDVLGMMNGRYIVSGLELKHPDLRLLAEPTTGEYETRYYVYEYKKALPRVYVAKKTESFPHAGVMDIVDAGKKFGQTTYLDCADCGDAHGVPGATLSVERSKNGYFEIRVDSPGNNWVVISEQYLPGWVVTVDGSSVAPVRANGVYMAVSVPKGKHTIVAEYEGIVGEARWLRRLGLFPYTPI